MVSIELGGGNMVASGDREPGPPTARDRALLDSVGAAVSDGLVAISFHGHVLWRNERFVSMFGEPSHTLCEGSTLRALVDSLPSDTTKVGDLVTQEGRPLKWSATPFAWAEGSGQLLRFCDASEHTLAQRTIQEQSERLRLLSAHTEGIIFELDSEARFVRVWTSDPKLLARPESEIIGRTLIEALGEEIGTWHDEKVRKILRTGVPEDYEYTLDVPNGRRIFAASNVIVPSLEKDEPAAIFWMRDITEQVQLRLKVLQAERLASVGMLAAGVAHEINNPLGYMLLNIGKVRTALGELDGQPRGGVVESLRAAIEMLGQGAERVRKIVDDLRTFSRADDVLGPVDVHRALEFSLDMTMVELVDRARVVREFGEVPLVVANEGRLGQLFINLVVNAAQSIARGNAADNEIRLATRTDPRGRAVIEVSDTGAGVPEAILDRIFDPFFTTKNVGTGLGLPICHGIVKAIGGEIEVEPRTPHGTTFRVLLPPASQAA
jgi:two-component system NtrC family sensor kinase